MFSLRAYYLIVVVAIATLAIPLGHASTPYNTGWYSGVTHTCVGLPTTHPGNGTWSLLYDQTCPTSSGYTDSVGIHSTTSDGASYIPAASSPSGAQHEVIATLQLKSTSAMAVVYLSSTSTTFLKNGSSPTGSGYVITMQYGGGDINGVFTASVYIRKIQYGATTSLAYFSTSTTSNATLRAVRTNVGGSWKILAYVNDNYLGSAIDSTFTTPASTKKPGFGMRDANANTYITQVTYHAVEHGAPDNGQRATRFWPVHGGCA